MIPKQIEHILAKANESGDPYHLEVLLSDGSTITGAALPYDRETKLLKIVVEEPGDQDEPQQVVQNIDIAPITSIVILYN